jgi:DNA/RNA endonuclease G (NUC1)
MKLGIITKLTFSLLLVVGLNTHAQNKEGGLIKIKNNVFSVEYSETLEQPIWVIYTSKNRVKNVDRGSMNFHTEEGIHTSDNKDYYRNIWDKGHMAPAATFSDSKENLFLTFSYLNCSLQNKYLNRGEWRLLEAQERVWDDTEDLIIKVISIYNNKSLVLSTGATVPYAYHKHIKFVKQNKIKCYYFLNDRPVKGWEDHDNTDKCEIKTDFIF